MSKSRTTRLLALVAALALLLTGCSGFKIGSQSATQATAKVVTVGGEVSVNQQPDGSFCASIGNSDQTIDLLFPDGYTINEEGVFDSHGNLVASAGGDGSFSGVVDNDNEMCGRKHRLVVSTD